VTKTIEETHTNRAESKPAWGLAVSELEELRGRRWALSKHVNSKTGRGLYDVYQMKAKHLISFDPWSNPILKRGR
jgi:hypothetical protein